MPKYEIDMVVKSKSGDPIIDKVTGQPCRISVVTDSAPKVEAAWLSNGFRHKKPKPNLKRGQVKVIS
jgi:hypothetical protein